MDNVDTHIINLLSEYLTGGISEEHRQELDRWLDEREENRRFFEEFCAERSFRQRWEMRREIDVEAAIRRFDARTGGASLSGRRRGWRVVASVAALLVMALGVAWLYWLRQPEELKMAETVIVPGSPKAVLVLANGEKVDLGGGDSLTVALAGGGQVVNQGKQLVYGKNHADEMRYNELYVPNGGEYDVVLADGTRVKLNAGSSLKYPEAFGGDRREVVLFGEAFFQVAKSEVPFLVKAGDLTVKVYGTSFNVNTHRTNRIQTVLVEGKVGIALDGSAEEYVLKPSQLADFDISTGSMKVADVDVVPYIAWTRGEFVFDNETLEQIMETLALWYDVEVFYRNPSLKGLHFTGYVKRYQSIEQILNALSQSVGVKFRQQGRTLTVSD